MAIFRKYKKTCKKIIIKALYFCKKYKLAIWCIVLILFLNCIVIGISVKKNYDEAVELLQQKSYTEAYNKISFVKNIAPNYRNTKNIYSEATALNFKALYYQALKEKKYEEAKKIINKADTGYYSSDVIAAYKAYAVYLANIDEANKYKSQYDLDNAIKKFKIAKAQNIKVLFDKKLIYDNSHHLVTYNQYLANLRNNEKILNQSYKERQSKFNYLKTCVVVNSTDYVENEQILVHNGVSLEHYFDVLTLLIRTKDNKVSDLLLYINRPCKNGDCVYIKDIYFLIDGAKEHLGFLSPYAKTDAYTVEMSFSSEKVTYIAEYITLNHDIIGDKLYQLINQIRKSKVTYMKLEGKEKYVQREITLEEKQAISDMYEYYYLRKYCNMK